MPLAIQSYAHCHTTLWQGAYDKQSGTLPVTEHAIKFGSNKKCKTYRFDNYDSHGNPTRITANTTDTDSLEWGYGGMYPTRHLHNGILMAEYSWKPLRGVSSVKKPNGYAEHYGYDDGGRLSSVATHGGQGKSSATAMPTAKAMIRAIVKLMRATA